MNLAHKYLKDYNITKKQVPINNISTDFTKTIKLLNNNYTYINNNKNNFSNKKLFQNVKLYNLIKPNNNNKYLKKRNYSYSSMYNNLTGGNFINNNSNNLMSSLFNSNLIKYNQKHYNTNSNIKPNKMLIKSKSNSNNGFIKKYPYKNLIIKTGEKNNINNKKLFSTFGIVNNLSIKNIKNYTKKISNSYKKNNNYKLQINQISENIPKRSSDIQEKINRYKKQIENYKKELYTKDDTIKKQIIKINEQNLIIQEMKKKLKKFEQEYNILKNNFIILKNKNQENEKNIKTMNKKELKLMQVLFLIKERGIDINSFLNEVNNISFNENVKELVINSIRDDDSNLNGNGINDLSGITVYFPDKVKMKNIMETNWGKNIPKLNFEYVPEYSSENNSDKNDQNNIVNDENAEFFQNIGKYQHSV
jgi:hypothetical protein